MCAHDSAVSFFPWMFSSVLQQTETSLCFDLRQFLRKNLLAEGQRQSNNSPNLSTQMSSERARGSEDQNLPAYNHSLLVIEEV